MRMQNSFDIARAKRRMSDIRVARFEPKIEPNNRRRVSAN